MIPTPVEPTGERHLGDDEPDMPSADEQAAMRAQLADEPASLGEGMSHSHGVGEVGAGANSVETASRASHGLVDTVKVSFVVLRFCHGLYSSLRCCLSRADTSA